MEITVTHERIEMLACCLEESGDSVEVFLLEDVAMVLRRLSHQIKGASETNAKLIQKADRLQFALAQEKNRSIGQRSPSTENRGVGTWIFSLGFS